MYIKAKNFYLSTNLKTMRIGIFKDTKTPLDTRVLLTPKQSKVLMTQYPEISIFVQASASRCCKGENVINLDLCFD